MEAYACKNFNQLKCQNIKYIRNITKKHKKKEIKPTRNENLSLCEIWCCTISLWNLEKPPMPVSSLSNISCNSVTENGEIVGIIIMHRLDSYYRSKIMQVLFYVQIRCMVNDNLSNLKVSNNKSKWQVRKIDQSLW